VNYDYDYLLVGGGLQNGLVAPCLQAARPGVHVGIVEQEAHGVFTSLRSAAGPALISYTTEPDFW
jgi:hypothetical protein